MIVDFEHHYIPVELGRRMGNFNNRDPRQGKDIDGVAEYIAEIRQLPLAEPVKQAMLGGTAARLLKLAR